MTHDPHDEEIQRDLAQGQGRLDTARLDWLEENSTFRGGGNGGVFTFATPLDTECFRDAIDAAMNSPHPKG